MSRARPPRAERGGTTAGGLAIKGPGHRTKFDVRRVWECPACHKRVRTAGHVVNLRCDCRPDVWMKLVEETSQTISEVSHVHGNLGQE